MQTTQETANALERHIDMSVAVADIDKDVGVRLKRLSKTVKMPGFRPGKVPAKIVAQTYEPQLRSEAIGAAVEKAFGEAVRAQNLRVAGHPRIEPKTGSAEGVLEFSAIFEVYPEIVIGDVSGHEIERPTLEVGDAEVDRTLEVLRKQHARFEAVDRAAAEGDQVVVDFTGRKDGVLFDGGQAQDIPFVLGSKTMLEDFEANVVGLKAGENKTFDLTFPEDYNVPLAGQTVQFEVAVKKVEKSVLPEIDADFAKTLGVDDGDVVKLREEVKDNLVREVRRQTHARLKEQVMDTLLAVAPIQVPKALVESEAEQLAENARKDLEKRGMGDKKIPVNPEWFVEQATRRVKLGLILAELVRANELFAKPEQVRALVEDMAANYRDPAEVVRWHHERPERLAGAEAVAAENNVVEWVCARAKVSDKTISFDDLMSSNKPAA